jgi:hypothetical protein
MATAPVGIAPVFTPQTFERLAGWAEESENRRLAASLREHVPFVLSLVEGYFRPLTTIRTEKQFSIQFRRFALRFEPFRLYLNAKILESLAGQQDLLSLYTRVLSEVFTPLVSRAEPMGFSSALIEAILRDYIFVLKTISQVAVMPGKQRSAFAQFEASIEWMHSATRLDYGLTAIFLALEKTLTFSRMKIRLALMVATKAAVLDLAATSSKFFDVPTERLSPVKLASTRLGPSNVEELGVRQRLDPTPVLTHGEGSTGRRAVELEWLKNNFASVSQHRGKWIVLEKEELVTSDVDYRSARAAATRRGIKRPFIIFIPLSENGGFMGV